MFASLFVATLLAAAPLQVDEGCEALRAPLRVRLTIETGRWRAAEPVVKQLVEETWTSAGLQIEWVEDGRTWSAIDFWIAIVHGLPTTNEGGVFGVVQFNGDRPGTMARISIDAVRVWAKRHVAERLQMRVNKIFGKAEDEVLVHRVLGYASAHELGHFVLATRSHADAGVMRESYQNPWTMFDAGAWRLDDQNAALLKKRLSNCEPANYGAPR